jgi:hypothetical protein
MITVAVKVKSIGNMRNAYKILVAKPGVERPPGRPQCG